MNGKTYTRLLEGATAVTSIGASLYGQGDMLVLVAKASGSVVKKGGNLKLIQTWESNEAGDTLTLLNYDGVNWTEIARRNPPISRTRHREEEFRRRNSDGFAVAETIPRVQITSEAVSANTSGQLNFFAIDLLRGDSFSHAIVTAGSTAMTLGENQWVALYTYSETAPKKIIVSEDLTSTAWPSGNDQKFTFAETYEVATSGLYFLGIMVKASVPPTFSGAQPPGTSLMSRARLLNGKSNTGLTNPASAPATAEAPASRPGMAHAWVN